MPITFEAIARFILPTQPDATGLVRHHQGLRGGGGALIALFGVVVTIRYNARKARELEEFKLALQDKTSSKALIAELSEYENGLKQTIDHLQKTQEMLTNIGAPPDPEG